MMLSLKVESLAELRQSLSAKGQHCYGAVFSDDVGKWAVQVRTVGREGPGWVWTLCVCVGVGPE
jgi:hypothetical protein